MPCHAREIAKFHTLDLLEEVLDHAFKHLDDILLLGKRHLAVDLCELWLTVGTEILVAEALHNLEITVEACYHEELLELLRRLWKSIELTWVHTRWHHEVACTLRSRKDEHWSLDFKEVLGIEITTGLESNLVTKFEVLAHTVATKVKITILHAEVVTAIGLVLDSERRNLGSADDIELADDDLNIASRDIFVLRLTFRNLTYSLNDEFAAEVICLFT